MHISGVYLIVEIIIASLYFVHKFECHKPKVTRTHDGTTQSFLLTTNQPHSKKFQILTLFLKQLLYLAFRRLPRMGSENKYVKKREMHERERRATPVTVVILPTECA